MRPGLLVLNCGSSNVKCALFDAGNVAAERRPRWKAQYDLADRTRDAALAEAWEAVRVLLEGDLPAAIVHRVVHGGGRYVRPVRIDARVLTDLRSYVPLAPLHQPAALDAVEALLARASEVPQLACFDTAFHDSMPRVERMLPLPRAYWDRGLRRHGFHGLSYEYLSIALPERHGERARGRCIAAHLGSGASLCAMRDLRSVATTMGFSALEGLMMGTRCGTLDPGVLLYLVETEGLAAGELSRMLYRDSGLAGVSGISADLRELVRQEAADEAARDAIALYVRRAVRESGALTAVLGGLDLLAFTAGVGENNAEVRRRICAELAFLGIRLDDAANTAHAPLISATGSRVAVAVEPANEEWIAARAALEVLRLDA